MAEMSWESAEERANQPGGGGLFINLQEDGDKYVGAFLPAPYKPHVKELVYDKKLETYRDYTPGDKEKGVQPTARFTMHVWVRGKASGEGSWKLHEMNQFTFQALIAAKNKYGFDQCFFEVQKHGVKKKSRYTVLADVSLTDADRVAMRRAEMPEIQEDSDGKTDMNSHKDEKGGGKTSDELISEADRDKLVSTLRPLQQAKIEMFLGKFEIKSVRDLRQSKLAQAYAYAAELAGKPIERDPFA